MIEIKELAMNKVCLECGEKIVGREDKKFCSDGCRNAYNNKMNKDSNNLMRNINNKLRKNYRILCELNPEEKSFFTLKLRVPGWAQNKVIPAMLRYHFAHTYFYLLC